MDEEEFGHASRSSGAMRGQTEASTSASEEHSQHQPPHNEPGHSTKVYVGNIGKNTSQHVIESLFKKYGLLRNVWLARKPPGFAFVTFVHYGDAQDAIRDLDGTRLFQGHSVYGNRIHVKMATGQGQGRHPSRSSRSSSVETEVGRYRSRSRNDDRDRSREFRQQSTSNSRFKYKSGRK